jgi:hypothetical protein
VAIVTAGWPDWIELIFHWSPDHGSGATEWLIVVVPLLAAIASSTLAALERKAQGASSLEGEGHRRIIDLVRSRRKHAVTIRE